MLAIVSAVESEIMPLIKLLNPIKNSDNTFQVTVNKRDILLTNLGVGFLEAGINLQSLSYNYPKISEVIFLGTAGFYKSDHNLKIGDICLSSKVCLFDAAAELKLSCYAAILKKEAIKSSLTIDIGLLLKKVATSLSLTLDNNLSELIASNNKAEVENMELFGIASVCDKKKILWNAVLGVTNQVGSNGHKDWMKNHIKIEESACKILFQYLYKDTT